MTQIRNKKGFIFTLEDLREPAGSNDLSPFAAMFQRSLYKERIYPKAPYAPAPLDTWYKRNLFGRLDAQQNTVIPDTNSIVQIPNTEHPIFALNFVSDAFGKFVDHILNAGLVGAMTTKGNPDIVKPVARRAYQDPTQQYLAVHRAISEQFVKSFQPPRSHPIENFQTFVKYYSVFLKSLISLFPITKTSYVLSYQMDPMCTGLSIAIAEVDPSDDKAKYEKFINDPNYDFYAWVAKRYGFRIDKNQPWVLTADLFSPALMVHVDQYVDSATGDRITRDNFFDVYYAPTYQSDINHLANILVDAYRLLVATEPLYQVERICEGDTFSYENIRRQKQDRDTLLGLLDHKFLIDFYVDLRQLESHESYKPEHVVALKQNAYNLYSLKMPDNKLTPLQRVAKEVNFRYRKYIYPANISQLTGVSPKKNLKK